MEIESKLKELRIKWKQNPQMREVIMRQVKALKYSREPYKNKSAAKHEKLVSEVIDHLI